MAWVFRAEDARSALKSRHGFVDYLRERVAASSDLDGAELIYSELVANVIRHAPGPIEVSVEWSGRQATLSVGDCGRGFHIPPNLALPVAESESGRGLYVVAHLADKLWTEHDGYHYVKAVLPVTGG